MQQVNNFITIYLFWTDVMVYSVSVLKVITFWSSSENFFSGTMCCAWVAQLKE